MSEPDDPASPSSTPDSAARRDASASSSADSDPPTRVELATAPTVFSEPAPGPTRSRHAEHRGPSPARERHEVRDALGAPTPATLGRYVVLGTLGSGGMGTVLEAFDRTLDRRVAVKVLHRELDDQHTARLLREAQALAKLSHPNVVQVYEAGQVEDRSFVAMELVGGRTLRAWMSQDPPPTWRECVEVFRQVGEGLAAAHDKGLVHRDFKPGNAILDDDGRARVLDFGLARQAGPVDGIAADPDTPESMSVPSSDTTSVQSRDSALGTPLTRTGTVMGTPAYMPPEQMTGRSVDARSDQFSFCVSLYEALYHERPFKGRTTGALVHAIVGGHIDPPPRGSDVPARLRQIVLRGLAAEPDARWPSMRALLDALERQVAPRRRPWLAVGLVGGLVVAGAGLWQYSEVGLRCSGAEARIAEVWDEPQRQRIREAILATERAYAPDTWERVEAGLDAYVGQWVASHTDACEDTRVRLEQSEALMDLRMACLREREVALRETVLVLSEADEARVRKAVELVAGLPTVSRCDDVEALQSAVPPPEDPAIATAVVEQRERLQRARTLRGVGAYDDALALTQEIVEQARTLDHVPLVAEALLARGHVHERKGDFAAAEADIEQAYLLAAESGHRRVEVFAASALVAVVGDAQARHELGLQWGKTALALAKGPAGTLHDHGAALNNIALVLHAQGKFDQALEHHHRVAELFEQAHGPDHPQVGGALLNIGNAHYGRSELDEAQSYYERALAIEERALGPEHPNVAPVVENIGIIHVLRGEHELALRWLQRALAIREGALRPDHPDIGQTLANLASLLHRQEAFEEALANYERALEIWTASLGPDHPNVASLHNSIGGVLQDQQRLDEALEHYQRGLILREAALGPDHPQVGASLYNIGLALSLQDQLEPAAEHYRRALAIEEKALGPDHPNLADSLSGLAEVALMQDDAAQARGFAERAVALCDAGEVEPLRRAEARFLLARVLGDDPAERAQARALAESAREIFAEAGELHVDDVAAVQQWLAEYPAD